MLSKRSQPGRSVLKFKTQVNLVYDDRTQQNGRAVNDGQEGAQESPLGGGGGWLCVEMHCILHTHTHMGKHALSSTSKGFCILLFVN